MTKTRLTTWPFAPIGIAVAAVIAALFTYISLYLPERAAAQQACRAVRLMMVDEPATRKVADAEMIGRALVACKAAGYLGSPRAKARAQGAP